MTVGQLGLSGTGGSANLFGSIAGVDSPFAALLGLRNPGPDDHYLFNTCIIASTGCMIIPMQFADLLAPNSVVLLGAGRGAVGATMTIGQLGMSGTGGSADLFGSIAGVGGPTAALRGLRNPGVEATYRFNDCIIASAFCTAQPVQIISQQPTAVLTALIPLPVLTATVNFITPETVRANSRQTRTSR